METLRLGKTELIISRTGFGALPIQRISMEDATALLRRAYDAGINFFDTARGYSDSEEKMGYALSDVRSEIVIATKSGADSYDGVMKDLEISLKNLRTDYIDLFQLHNPGELPDPDDSSSSYAALLKAREAGMIRHIGITSHRMALARQSVQSGLYETLQFPLSLLSNSPELEMIKLCKEHDVGVIAMKALCGGLLTDVDTAFAFLRGFENVVPIWGCQAVSELDDFIRLEAAPPQYDRSRKSKVEQEREQLGSNFCRACGYCLPCSADIPIPMAARMSLLLRRMPAERFYSDEWWEKMHLIENCEQCGKCHERCPYDLDPAVLMPEMLKDYKEMYVAHQQNNEG